MIASTSVTSAKPDREAQLRLPRGFKNRGNDCFLCATLQVVAHDTALRDYLLAATPTDGSLGAAMKEVLVKLQGHSAGSVDPTGVRDILGLTALQFAGDGPGDASELFAWLLSGLHDELCRPSCAPPHPVCLAAEAAEATGRKQLEGVAKYDDAWLTYWQTNSTKIAELCHGMQHTTSVCLECHRHSDESSPFSIVSLSLPDDRSDEVPVELRRCISGWCEPATEPTVVFCSHCGDFRPGTQQRTISRFPPCLTFHIQRLDEHALRTAVTCPLVLSSEILCATWSTGSGGAGGAVGRAMNAEEYELHAVTHVALDYGTRSTHYYSCCKQVCHSAYPHLPQLTHNAHTLS
jgi:ubiquitin C-terminal hydrolase